MRSIFLSCKLLSLLFLSKFFIKILLMSRKILKFTFIVLLLCLIYCFTVYFFQDRFLFNPDKNYKSPQEVNTPDFVEIPVKAKDGTQLMTWYFKGKDDKPLILYFHGNSYQLSAFTPHLIQFTKLGYSIALLEYRGFGNTKGKISQETVFSDAVDFYDYYKDKTNNKIIFYGYSFGCAVVMGLTQNRTPDGIILTAPFSSFYNEVKDKYYAPFAYCLLKDKYPSEEYIKNISSPILIMHGKKDKLINPKHSQKMFDLAPVEEKQIIFIEDINHHDIFFKEINVPIIIKWLEQFN